jgi:aspartate kinase
MLTVEKIGGTSMTAFADVLKNIILRPELGNNVYNRVFVVSAYAGVTDLLLEHKKTGAPGIYMKFVENSGYYEALDDLEKKLLALNENYADLGLDLKEAKNFVVTRIQKTKETLDSLASVMASGYVDKSSLLLAAREILASIGEAHSAFNSANIINAKGYHATFLDLSGDHDSLFYTIDERIHHMFQGIDCSKTIVIATGYAKGTEGIMREFDRGYSEVTFSKVAIELKADEAIIHKEFHLSSADPKIVGVDKVVPVGFTNFDVMDQLADIGMEAIHPKASKPLENANINIRVKNTFEPDHPGTLISKSYTGPQSKVEVITGSDKVVVIDIHDPGMVAEVGFDKGIMEIFEKYKISYIMKTTNANSISTVIWEKKVNEKFLNELKAKYDVVTNKPVAVICMIGTNIAMPGVLAKAAQVLAEKGINVECMSQALRQVNMQFVIARDRYKEAIIALNESICFNNHC